jgi:hypothetical protein
MSAILGETGKWNPLERSDFCSAASISDLEDLNIAGKEGGLAVIWKVWNIGVLPHTSI